MKKIKPDAKNSQQGFSLLETAIALVIMMVVTLGTASLYVYATNYNAGSADRAAALAIAQQKMERLRRTSFSDTLLAAGTTTENITYVNHQYVMTTTVCATSDCGGSSARKIVTVQVSPQGSSSWANIAVTLVSERATPALGEYVSY